MVKTDFLKFEESRGFFGRRLGRPLSPARQKALDELYPQYAIDQAKINEDGALNLFQNGQKTIFEIGFGDGDRLAQMIERHPDYNYIGAEPYKNGMSAFLLSLKTQANNVRLSMDDAMPLARSLTDDSIDELYILNPDPWHKTKHHKRRIVNTKNLNEFACILKPNGLLYMSTDVPYLAEWMVAHAVHHPAFEWTANSKSDWETPPKDWIHTTYETKGAKGAKVMHYFIFKRKA
ncbi:MAG: tRNA (guanosine(46)-N7)-methyltransferase TrmB [Pseudomonadota bacterium]